MSVWRDATGRDIVMCDGCGRGEDGQIVDKGKFTRVDLVADARAAGLPMPTGTQITVTDTCPDCQPGRKFH